MLSDRHRVSATMKSRFSTLDIISILEELQQYVGMRVNQVRQFWDHSGHDDTNDS